MRRRARRILAATALAALCAVAALLALWGYLWAQLHWSQRGLSAFEAAAFGASLGVVAAIWCALEDRKARS